MIFFDLLLYLLFYIYGSIFYINMMTSGKTKMLDFTFINIMYVSFCWPYLICRAMIDIRQRKINNMVKDVLE